MSAREVKVRRSRRWSGPAIALVVATVLAVGTGSAPSVAAARRVVGIAAAGTPGVPVSTRTGLGAIRPPDLASGGLIMTSSCVLGPVCVEIGWNHHGERGYTWAARWQDGRWRELPAPPAIGVPGVASMTLSCSSASWCMVTGSVQTSDRGVMIPYSAALHGRTWTRERVPNPKGASDLSLNLLDCLSPSWCMATGSYVASKPDYTDAQFLQSDLWDGTGWHSVAIYSPRTYLHQIDPGMSPGGNHPTAELGQLACVTRTFCMVAGSWVDGAFIEQWNGRRWSEVHAPDQPGYPKGDTELSGAACPSASFCVAVGGYGIANGIWGAFVDQWNGHTWVHVVMPKNFHGINYYGGIMMRRVECASERDCVSFAVLNRDLPGGELAVEWDGASWRYREVGTFVGGALVCLTHRFCSSQY